MKINTDNHRIIHGMNDTRLNGVWRDMRYRCNNSNSNYYSHYGGRGIKVCDEWNEFINFYEWSMKNGYKEGLSIDRIDVDKGYSPENCRWVDMKTQQRNRRNNRIIEYNGMSLCIAEWSEVTGLHRKTIAYRLDNGWSIEDTLTKPKGKYKRL